LGVWLLRVRLRSWSSLPNLPRGWRRTAKVENDDRESANVSRSSLEQGLGICGDLRQMRRNDESSPVWSEQQRHETVPRQKIRTKLFAKPFGAQVLLDILHVDAERGRCPFVEDWELK